MEYVRIKWKIRNVSLAACTKIMRLRGIEPPHAAPEATALSTELQTHLRYHTILFLKMQEESCIFFKILL